MLTLHDVSAKIVEIMSSTTPNVGSVTVNGLISTVQSNIPSISVPTAKTVAAAAAAVRPANPDYQMPAWAQSLVTKIQYISSPAGSATKKKLLLGLLFSIIAGYTVNKYYLEPAAIKRKKDWELKHPELKEKTVGTRHKVAVDRIFFNRLGHILRIVIPNIHSVEFAYLCILTVLLVARTVFSIYIAELVGTNAQALVARRWGQMFRGIQSFALITIPASAVNAGLKYFTEMLSLRFRLRLSQSVHDEYLDGVNFYKASNLGGSDRIDNADQRVTADIKDFSDEIASLYASILKPLLDVVLFTYKLGSILGWQGPLCMHSYFLLSGLIKKRIMPNLGKLVAKESELEGYYRTAHNRLITNSEEIAFYDGSKKEKIIINNSLQSIYTHVSYARYIKALIGIFDGLLVKYYASIAGYITLLSPLVLDLDFTRGLKTSDLTRDYIRNSQYLGNLSTAVGQLVIVGNKLTSIAGYTSRVSELLEMVRHLNSAGNKPFIVKPEEVAKDELQQMFIQSDDWIQSWKARCDAQLKQRLEIRRSDHIDRQVVGGGTLLLGDSISFEHVDIVSPEGKLLVHDLNFTVDPGVNVMITGPNGVGKSSLFRIIGELWPLHCGTLTKPYKEEILFVPQKPYLVLGTLRDQVIYPHTHKDMLKLGVTDADLANLLAIVDPAQNILREWAWDHVSDWFHSFSGGQKQRIAMARLFYHRPKFAILDECTSAVSDEVEATLYLSAKKLGITIFTVSHRVSLAKFHDKILRFEGKGKWTVLDVDQSQFKNTATLITPVEEQIKQSGAGSVFTGTSNTNSSVTTPATTATETAAATVSEPIVSATADNTANQSQQQNQNQTKKNKNNNRNNK